MRLAEFKMRLLVFFAGALRKWAGSIEPALDLDRDQQARQDNPVDDSGAVASESRRASGAASGPPEHWTRLVATAPPDHWLDLIRERAPHLLPKNESESVVRTADRLSPDGPQDRPLETQVDSDTGTLLSGASGSEESSTSKTRLRQRVERKVRFASRGSRAKWLSRLRFQPPKQRADIDQTAYPTNEATARSEDGVSWRESGNSSSGHESRLTLADGGDRGDRADPGSEAATDRQPTRRPASADSARRTRESGDEAYEVSARRRHLKTGTTPNESRDTGTGAATRERRRQYEYSHEYGSSLTSSEARPEQAPRETNNEARQRRAATDVPNTFVDRAEIASTRSPAPGNSAGENEPRLRSTYSGKLAGEFDSSRSLKFAEAGKDATSSPRGFQQHSADRPAVTGNRHPTMAEEEPALDHEAVQATTRRTVAERVRASAKAMTANGRAPAQSQAAGNWSRQTANNPATGDHEQRRARFASVDLTPVESSESMWPTLPRSRNFETDFEIRDELAAMEREVESLRRLDREQRGTSWNA